MNQHMDPSRAPELTGVAKSSLTESLTLVRVDVDLERPFAGKAGANDGDATRAGKMCEASMLEA